MKGGSALYTAKAVSVGSVSQAMSRVWGEALWTAPALADAEFQRRLEAVSVKMLLGVSLDRCLEAAARP